MIEQQLSSKENRSHRVVLYISSAMWTHLLEVSSGEYDCKPQDLIRFLITHLLKSKQHRRYLQKIEKHEALIDEAPFVESSLFNE